MHQTWFLVSTVQVPLRIMAGFLWWIHQPGSQIDRRDWIKEDCSRCSLIGYSRTLSLSPCLAPVFRDVLIGLEIWKHRALVTVFSLCTCRLSCNLWQMDCASRNMHVRVWVVAVVFGGRLVMEFYPGRPMSSLPLHQRSYTDWKLHTAFPGCILVNTTQLKSHESVCCSSV